MYAEGPWLYKRGEIYYMIFSAECCPQNLQYAMGPSVTGPWTYGGVIMDSEPSSQGISEGHNREGQPNGA